VKFNALPRMKLLAELAGNPDQDVYAHGYI
jgi:hypothetical protein